MKDLPAASVIAMIDVSAKVASLCFQYLNDVKDAEEDIQHLKKKVDDIRDILRELKQRLERPDETRLPVTRTLTQSLQECLILLQKLEAQLELSKTRKAMRQLGAMEWYFRIQEMEKIVASLGKHEQTFSLLLQIDQKVDFAKLLTASDITGAIKFSQEAVELTPAGNPHRARRLDNLSIHLRTRYETEGRPEDLDQAIEHSQEAVDLTPASNPDRVRYLSNLSDLLRTRYERVGWLKNLDQAIEHSQEAVNLTSAGNPDRARYLDNLSDLLRTRYERVGWLENLDQAIEYSQEAVNLTSAGNPDRATCLENLSNLLDTRYKREGRLEDLNQVIEHSQEAVNLTSAGNPDRARYLDNLSDLLRTRYERVGWLENLDQAIEYSQEAVNLTSAGNPDRATCLENLSNLLSTRYEREGRLEDPAQANDLLRTSGEMSPSSVLIREGPNYGIKEPTEEKGQDHNEDERSVTEGQHTVDPASSETFGYVDSAYGTASHGRDNGRFAMHSDYMKRIDSTEEDKVEARSIYSMLSTTTSVMPTYLQDLADELFSAIRIPQTNTERLQRLCKALEQLLQQFAFRIGVEVSSREGQEILYHVHRNRRLAPRFTKLDYK